MGTEPTETCLFFVDDSNIWIEAQKFAASGAGHLPKLKTAGSDPRLRIDVGALIRTLCRGRRQGASFLYGSRPPPNDSVWKQMEKFGFELSIFDRANGKEKEVDTAMATELAWQASFFRTAAADRAVRHARDSTTFVVISGDRDMIPPIKRTLRHGIRVELWALQASIAKDYFGLETQNDLFAVNLLEWIFDKVFYTNYRSTHNRKVDPGQTVVLCDFPVPDAGNNDDVGHGVDGGAGGDSGDNGDTGPSGPNLVSIENYVGAQLLQLGHLFYTTRFDAEAILCVEFPKLPSIDRMVHKARALFEKDQFTVLSWPAYKGRAKTVASLAVKKSNRYASLPDEGDEQSVRDTDDEDDVGVGAGHDTEDAAKCPTETDGSTAPVDPTAPRGEQADANDKLHNVSATAATDDDDLGRSDGYTVVSRFNPGKHHRRTIERTQRCAHGLRCKKADACGFWHTDAERHLFRDHPHVNFALWKTRKCERSYWHPGSQCPFAHTDGEAWCRRCQQQGHYGENCRYQSLEQS
ncbi:hypothetical protein SPI_06433 [Niveomyces insectorum RCEF 264]|uniref:NYN domain-containing protein n=1 Tax=Niveomyces insectorum RCEF 264 TaxID=1081102 RepID=A0A167S4M2_9HYPO|nr:hypothetical protein SPI_06433 [Niveomyces insectorum RCEF 264]